MPAELERDEDTSPSQPAVAASTPDEAAIRALALTDAGAQGGPIMDAPEDAGASTAPRIAEPEGVVPAPEAAAAEPVVAASVAPAPKPSDEQPALLGKGLWTDAIPQTGGTDVATASIADYTASQASLSPGAAGLPPAEIAIASIHRSDPASADAATDDSLALAGDAAECPRDWVADEEGSQSGCHATLAMLVEPGVENLQAALEDAAAEQAQVLAALPRVPLARPDPPSNFKPSKTRTKHASCGRS